MKPVLGLVGVALIALIALGLLGGAVYVRAARDDPARWHADPEMAVRPVSPNAFLIRADTGDMAPPVFPVPPSVLAQAVADVALGEPRTVLLAGAPEDLHMTFVQRSALWRFPDYISVRVGATPDGASLSAFSRSRFGRSDLGVNEARMIRWLEVLTTRLNT
ncbi:uncharacterized protein (DUF1499 family) [Rhodovulum imhoffii]|uniref:Uncharacterized protein (DUF1499 family) n=1 Tax=Rhodovulum imhoffii TaxID=365340 RepID=A0A2T5BVL0_9RHOB|nr:DUF1499 domain-containing protein [Rhodovulum imhoffii]MBK5932810.1 hypothetical protein [Rhodovulum imhoffii]PTN03621.1 uncharacterized protein (DUF1499 family) [Rhodovulum imhoffii]